MAKEQHSKALAANKLNNTKSMDGRGAKKKAKEDDSRWLPDPIDLQGDGGGGDVTVRAFLSAM